MNGKIIKKISERGVIWGQTIKNQVYFQVVFCFLGHMQINLS
nr:MAG TPA: hypothetical protein [Caudoviricetes sp.]